MRTPGAFPLVACALLLGGALPGTACRPGGSSAGGSGGNLASGGGPGSTGGAPGVGGGSGGQPPSTGTGGSPAGGAASGGTPGSGASEGSGAEPGSGGDPGVAVDPLVESLGEDRLGQSGLSVVSYGGYVNGEAFQQDGILSFGGYQYAAFWNTNRNVVLARRTLPTDEDARFGAWEKFDFTDHELSADDAHNTISLGVSPADGVLHLAFDHHDSPLHYRRSVPGLLTEPQAVSWSSESFTQTTSSLTGTGEVTRLTYPRFVTRPAGDRLLLSARLGESGSGDEHLWEYDASSQTWQSLGEYVDGTSDGINAYLHGIAYGQADDRLYVAFCWRETPDASTNFGLYFAYSDDHGRTFRNDEGDEVGATGATPLTSRTEGLEVWDIPVQRGLINQEHMAVDAAGRVHVLLSHMPDDEPDRADFTQARSASEYFVYTRLGPGEWRRRPLDEPSVLNFRGKLAIAPSNNVYAVLPDLRIVAASPTDDFASWSSLHPGEAGRFFSDPLVDLVRAREAGALTVYYPAANSADIWSLDFSLK